MPVASSAACPTPANTAWVWQSTSPGVMQSPPTSIASPASSAGSSARGPAKRMTPSRQARVPSATTPYPASPSSVTSVAPVIRPSVMGPSPAACTGSFMRPIVAVAFRPRAGENAGMSTPVVASAKIERTPEGWRAPGIANLHSHAFQRAMAGMAERQANPEDSFWTGRETIYRFAARFDPDTLHAVAAQPFVEMLEAGYTRVCEFPYPHHAPHGLPSPDKS